VKGRNGGQFEAKKDKEESDRPIVGVGLKGPRLPMRAAHFLSIEGRKSAPEDH
jgi:hypothetical protein